MNDVAMLSFHQVTFSYARTPVLQQLDFSMSMGERVALTGPNGSGKSTFIRLILGFLKPQKGLITFLGKTNATRRREIAYIPQVSNVDTSFPITVEEVVAMGVSERFLGHLDKKQRLKVREAMEYMDITSYANELFETLSGGFRQRVFIARALTHSWKLFILDEPYSYVDQHIQRVLTRMIEEMGKDKSLILVTHSHEFTEKQFPRVMCFHQGKLLSAQTCDPYAEHGL